MTRISAILIASVSIALRSGYCQIPEDQSRVVKWVNRIQQLSRQLRVESAEDAKAFTVENRDRVTALTIDEIAKHTIDELARESLNLKGLREQLRQLNGGRKMSTEYSGAPYILTGSIDNQATVVTAAVLLRGGDGSPDSKAIIQGYRHTQGSWKLVDQTGDEFDRHGLFITEIGSTRRAQQWFLVHGELLGGNGKMVRMRLYSFNGESFKVLWSPPDQLKAAFSVTDRVLTVSFLDAERYYQVQQPPYTRTERWALTDSGVQKLSSTLSLQ